LPKPRGDLTWLLACADELAEDRHDAIHAPCSLYIRGDDGSREVMAAVRSAEAGNRRAKNLEEKDLLVEFAWCAWRARDLCMLADMLAAAIQGRQTWPERPKLLSRADFSEESARAAHTPRIRWQASASTASDRTIKPSRGVSQRDRDRRSLLEWASIKLPHDGGIRNLRLRDLSFLSEPPGFSRSPPSHRCDRLASSWRR
jgi:hypothetical protein